MASTKQLAVSAVPSPAQLATVAAPAAKKARQRLSQDDVPGYSLDQALRVAKSIADSYAYKPTRPMNVAGAMGMTPTSGPFRSITGASVAYGLTTGAAQAPEIGITPLGMRVVRPTTEGDDIAAKREALLKPKVVGEFLRGYDGAALPVDSIAKNVLLDKGVPSERLDSVLELIVEGAKAVGFIREYGGKRYVDLAASIPATEDVGDGGTIEQTIVRTPGPRPFSAPTPAPAAVSVGAGIHINIEIHIAADASSATIEEIFKNMRRYVLTDGKGDDGHTEAE